MSTLITPRTPAGPPSPDDDDQTGVRALLSGLPEPDPMPAYLVERISASLAAEQAQRAAISMGAPVAPLLASRRRTPGRILLAIAGAAAAVVLIAVVGNNMLPTSQTTTAGGIAASAIDSGSREDSGRLQGDAESKAAPGSTSMPASIRIRVSDVRYTQTDFSTQARALGVTALDSTQPEVPGSADVGPIATPGGLTDCLSAIGAGGAQLVQADLAFYEGRPAVIIVTTTDGISTAYAVGRDCSRANPALLRPATPLP